MRWRPAERGRHDALDALCVAIKGKRVNWVLEAYIKGFFDGVDHPWLLRCVKHRVGGERVTRPMGKLLKAGVLEDVQWSVSDQGTPQGPVISPLPANVYLHYVFDLWVQQWRRRGVKGDMIVVCFADDLVVGFELESEARRFWDAIRRWFALPVALPSLDRIAAELQQQSLFPVLVLTVRARNAGTSFDVCGRSRPCRPACAFAQVQSRLRRQLHAIALATPGSAHGRHLFCHRPCHQCPWLQLAAIHLWPLPPSSRSSCQASSVMRIQGMSHMFDDFQRRVS